MRPALGWTLLSREDLRRAERLVASDEEGVRDEIGFLALHQSYADRFFPGTSVLQTRLRYVLFVPWLYQRIAEHADPRPVRKRLEDAELALVKRLKDGKQAGIIGGDSHPKPVSQTADMVYWNALGRWGILRRQNGALPSRKAVHRHLERPRPRPSPRDLEGEPLEDSVDLFCRLPSCPVDWNQDTPLTFEMSKEERQFVRDQLITVVRDADGQPSLLARLAEQESIPSTLWAIASADYGADDRQALKRARRAASLAAIGRAVYAALVEQKRGDDGLDTPPRHREHLEQVRVEHRAKALRLDVDAMLADVPELAGRRIVDVLRETQRWLARQGDPGELDALYADAERARKGVRRARLDPTLGARKLRAEWNPAKHALATPLHYRWGHVHRLLRDLVMHGTGNRDR